MARQTTNEVIVNAGFYFWTKIENFLRSATEHELEISTLHMLQSNQMRHMLQSNDEWGICQILFFNTVL